MSLTQHASSPDGETHHTSTPALASPKAAADSTSRPRQATWAELFPEGVTWSIVLWIGLLHVGALAAFWTFTWQALVLTVALHWLTGGIGLCLGYHRLFTHDSFKTYAPVRYLIALIGGLAGEGPVLEWVANHRKHHAHSDKPGDPHSPHDGPWWSHMFWFTRHWTPAELDAHRRRWIPDLLPDRGLAVVGALFIPSHFALAAILGSAGYLLGGAAMAASLVVWGVFVRTVFVLHSTWFVNSATHMWGYINYKTRDDSRNNWWVALLTYGEGWHNNHHAYPRMANHGHRWWEVDLTYSTIRLMEAMGLAWDVVDSRNEQEKMRRNVAAPAAEREPVVVVPLETRPAGEPIWNAPGLDLEPTRQKVRA